MTWCNESFNIAVTLHTFALRSQFIISCEYCLLVPISQHFGTVCSTVTSFYAVVGQEIKVEQELKNVFQYFIEEVLKLTHQKQA